jgi:hypothetical protein
MLVIREEGTVPQMEGYVMRYVFSTDLMFGYTDRQDDILPTFGAGPNDLVRHFMVTHVVTANGRLEKSHQPGYHLSKP